MQKEFSQNIILKMVDNKTKEIIGSVRYHEENDRVYTGKLMVHPNYQNRGIGTKLLEEIETYYKNKTFELFTNAKSEKNILFYERIGYKEFKRKKISEKLELVFLEK